MSEEQGGRSSDELATSNKKKNKSNGIQKAQKAKQNYDKAKKRMETLKNLKSIAPLISALGMAFVVLIIILLIIGFIGFFTTLPSIAIEKFMEVCKGFWRWATGNEEIEVDSDNIDDLANYIESLGYDLIGYGFVSPTKDLVEHTEKDSKNKTGGKTTIHWELEDINEPVMYNLYAYILANERTYTTQNTQRGFLDAVLGSIPGVRRVGYCNNKSF